MTKLSTILVQETELVLNRKKNAVPDVEVEIIKELVTVEISQRCPFLTDQLYCLVSSRRRYLSKSIKCAYYGQLSNSDLSNCYLARLGGLFTCRTCMFSTINRSCLRDEESGFCSYVCSRPRIFGTDTFINYYTRKPVADAVYSLISRHGMNKPVFVRVCLEYKKSERLE